MEVLVAKIRIFYEKEDKSILSFHRNRSHNQSESRSDGRKGPGMQLGQVQYGTIVDPNLISITWFQIWIWFRFQKYKSIEDFGTGSHYSSEYRSEF